MDERMDLLKIAEEKNMSSFEFMDFVINYINCLNDEEDKTVYIFLKSSSNRGLYYIKKM